ncbi:hypothetical protein E2C01_021728 [Portunus trituberculatus]|uniref:Uncharacterized protein n=1 Tax=Portunus trituberculatus TaxID=210409 RepID=A0A5B7E3C3_PORTR|nr:hypothetical protein [Portunus trituberculatus]
MKIVIKDSKEKQHSRSEKEAEDGQSQEGDLMRLSNKSV